MSLPFDTGMIHLDRGEVLGDRYVLDAPLGEGSMAEVWRAWDEQTESWVATKVVAELLAPSPRARQRFAREVAAIGRIHHPNVVRLIDHGHLEDARPFLVMEYIAGETLADHLDRSPRLDLETALGLARQLLAGLAAAHAQGVIHRDLKPANIVVAGSLIDDHDALKILDFGVARMLDIAGEDSEQRLTATGTMLGSPRYMPLEVARGAPDVDARADIFEAGAVLYDALTGHPPFPGGAIGVVIKAIINHDIAPLAQERPDLPSALVEVLERALAPTPEARWQSAQAMAQALEQAFLG